MKIGMKFEDLADGESMLIDANIFIYHFTGKSKDCYDLLRRCESGRLVGYTTQNILIEILHRLMVLEAIGKRLLRGPNPAGKLKEKPEYVRQLSDYFYESSMILQMGIHILPLPQNFIEKSHEFRVRYGLLVNDSITVAIMIENAVCNLATSDLDFQRVRELRVFAPSDL